MGNIVFIAVLVGELTITSYRPVKEQTDSTPFYTSTNERVRAGGCAVSRDLLCSACRRLHHRCQHPENATKLHYGDWIFVDHYGFRQVNDVMAAYSVQRINGRRAKVPLVRRIDIFVYTWKEEHTINVQNEKVFVVRRSE